MTLCEFLLECKNGYDLEVEGKVRPFSSLQFSQSSMSVYVPVVKDDTIHNHMLITCENGVMRFDGVTLRNKVTGEPTYVKNLVFNDEGAFAESKTMETLWHWKLMQDVYNSVRTIRSVLYPSDSKLTWTGGSHDYAAGYLVIPKYDVRALTKKSACCFMSKLQAGKLENLSVVETEVWKYLRTYPRVLQKQYEVDEITDLTEVIYSCAARLYLYRVSCMFSKTIEFPVIVNENFRIVEEGSKAAVSDAMSASSVF